MFWIAFVSLAATVAFGVGSATQSTGFMQLDSIDVKPPGFVSGTPAHIRVTLMNKGAAPVFRVRFFPAICVLNNNTGNDAEQAKVAKQKFKEAWDKAAKESELTGQEGLEVGVGAGTSLETIYPLKDKELDGLKTGTSRLFVLWWAQWDKYRTWKHWHDEMNACVMLRPLNTTSNEVVWMNCS
ncbi:MAG: hypothetical protein WAQ52_11540 [Terriglobales bacterium]